MKIAITGGTGFVGRHLAHSLVSKGHQVVLIARGVDRRDSTIRQLRRATFAAVGIDNEEELTRALAGCEAVAHCAGINREWGAQTYQTVHVDGTVHVVNAAKRAGVNKLLLLSFLRARPDCGSPYHESKWAAEEIVRSSSLVYTILKAGMIYGKGDHMLDHLSHALHTLPLFATVGLKEKSIRPVAVEDVVQIIEAALVENRLSRQTVAVIGPDEMKLSDAVRQVAKAVNRPVFIFPMPVMAHYFVAWFSELTMKIPLLSRAQAQMLAEGITEPLPPCDSLPLELAPKTHFTEQQIHQRLPEPGPFSLKDCRCLA